MEVALMLGLGIIIGLLSSIFGIGGGVLIVPLLPLVSVMETQQEVIATSLFTILLVVLKNTYFFSRKRLVEWKVVAWMGSATAMTAFFSGKAALLTSSQVLQWVLTAMLLLFSVLLIRSYFKKEESFQVRYEGRRKRSFSLGLLAGVLSGFTGVGSGVIVSPLMIHLQMVAKEKISPTANGVMIFTTFFGSLAFMFPLVASESAWRLGAIHVDKALCLVLGAWLSSFAGGALQGVLPLKIKKLFLGILLLLLALRVLFFG